MLLKRNIKMAKLSFELSNKLNINRGHQLDIILCVSLPPHSDTIDDTGLGKGDKYTQKKTVAKPIVSVFLLP